jgi:hypothetical protein
MQNNKMVDNSIAKDKNSKNYHCMYHEPSRDTFKFKKLSKGNPNDTSEVFNGMTQAFNSERPNVSEMFGSMAEENEHVHSINMVTTAHVNEADTETPSLKWDSEDRYIYSS